MEIDFNKEESTEISIRINFSIRDYVAEICKKNPVRCWPFGSLHDIENKVVSSYQSSECTFLSGQNSPSKINGLDDTTELTKASNLFKVENLNKKEDQPETTSDMTKSFGVNSNLGKIVCNGSSELTFFKVNNCQNQHKKNVDEGAKIGVNEAADHNNEPGRNRTQRRCHKFRLLSDIYKDPASKLRACCDRTNPENVNRRFVAEIEDDSDDDVTLAAYFKQQKGVEVTSSTLNKKRDMIGVEEPSVDQDRKSKHGSKDLIRKDSNAGTSNKKSRTDDMDTKTMPQHKKEFQLQCSQKSNKFAEISSKEATEAETDIKDSEMQAVMLLARHFNEQKQILRELNTNPTYACTKKKTRERSRQSGNKAVTKTSSKTAQKHPVKKITNKKLNNDFCSVQRTCLQSHFESSMMKASAVCSFNRNPADFSTPNSENQFMRGC